MPHKEVPPALAATACAAVLLLAGCPGESGKSGTSPDGAQRSLNWAGYVRASEPNTFTSVSGAWVVPAVNCSGDDSASSTWTGIGGGTAADPTLIQAGTSQDCFGGEAQYEAWWEAVPAPAASAGGPLSARYPVGAGDQITVSIDGSSAVLWTITIYNATRAWTFTTRVGYTAAGASAEWIHEAPLSAGTSGAGQLPLAPFGRVHIAALSANGAPVHLGMPERMVMEDLDGAVVANTSGPAGDSFDVCYGSGDC